MLKWIFVRLRSLFYKLTESRLPEISERKTRRRKKKYSKRLVNRDFTILCSNCIGGEIYNRLGLQFKSPTINMWMSQQDFIEFALNPKHYVEQPLEFVETAEATPVAACDGIILHFNHSESSEAAQRDWDRRKARINYGNIYIIFYADKLSIEEIRKIEAAKCKNIAVITDKPLPLDYAVEMQTSENDNSDYAEKIRCIDKDRYGLYTFEKQWDFVGWLNSERRG